MSTPSGSLAATLLDGLKTRAGNAKAVGIALILAGVLAIAAPFVSGISVMVVVGMLMIAGAIGLGLLAFSLGAFGRGLPLLLLTMLTLLAGVTIVTRPVAAMASVTLLLAVYFAVSGIVEIAVAFGDKPTAGRGWVILSGLASLVLGVMLWRHFPASAGMAVGVLFGVRLFLVGVWLYSVASAVGRVGERVGGAIKS